MYTKTKTNKYFFLNLDTDEENVTKARNNSLASDIKWNIYYT